MPFDTFKKAGEALRTASAVFLQCNAEPLLNPHIAECIAFAKSVNKNITVGFVTNGALLGPEAAANVIKAGIDIIYISVDGAAKSTYEALRRGAGFEAVVQNIKELVRQRNSSINDLREIGICAVASRLNIGELPDILDLAASLGVNSMSVNGLEVYRDDLRGKELYACPGADSDAEYEKIFSLMRDKAAKNNICLRLPFLRPMPYYICQTQSCVVSWDGDVSPCASLSYKRPYWYFGRKLVHPKIVFGNINKTSLTDIWNSKDYRKFRSDLTHGKFPVYCRSCLMRNGVLC